MKTNILEMSLRISKIKAIDLANTAQVGRNMAEKYKKFQNVPSLPKAVLLEDKYNIPSRVWVDIKKYNESKTK